MTHITQLRDLIAGMLNDTSTTVDIYPVAQLDAPSVIVWPTTVDNADVYQEEKYNLYVRATTLANLETRIAALQKISSKYPTGWPQIIYKYITANFDSVKTDILEPPVYTLLTDTGKLGLTIGPATTHKALIQAEFESISITSLSLLLTPDGTTAGALTGYIYAKATNYTISSSSDWLAAVDAIEDDDLKDTINISTWTDDSENSYTLANISAGVAGTQTQIAFYITVQNAFATKTFDAARIKVLLGTTDYPYWIDVQIKNKAYNTNEFMAELELTARWAL